MPNRPQHARDLSAAMKGLPFPKCRGDTLLERTEGGSPAEFQGAACNYGDVERNSLIVLTGVVHGWYMAGATEAPCGEAGDFCHAPCQEWMTIYRVKDASQFVT